MKKNALYYTVRKRRTELKNIYFKAKADQLNFGSQQRNTEEEFRLMKRHTSVSRLERPLVSTQKLEQHFSAHFKDRGYTIQPELEQPKNYPHVLSPAETPVINFQVPDQAEVMKCIRKLKNGKCQGTDNIYSEELKYSTSKKMLKHIMLLIVLIWNCLRIPSNWLIASISCLHKKGLKSLAENYRGLSITSTLSKVLSGIVVDRIREAYEFILLESQFGFRTNRSTPDAIYILRQLLVNTAKTKTPVYIAFVDLKAAYDWIPRDALFKCLEVRLNCPHIVSILCAFYTSTQACIKGSIRLFDTMVGCRQGALESPLLFNIYMDFVVRIARYEVFKKYPDAGIKVDYCIPNDVSPRDYRNRAKPNGSMYVTELLYADDEAIFANSIQLLKNILEIYDQTFSRFGLQISYSKTETMAFNVKDEIKNQECLLMIGNNKIKNVRSFKYLGFTITNDEEDKSRFLHARIGAAFQKWNELKHVLTDRRIHLPTRVKFLTTCVRSRLLYSIQTWLLTEKELEKIETVWHGFLRKMVRGGYQRKNAPNRREHGNGQMDGELDWSFKISNQRLRDITNTMPLRDFCYKQHLQFIAHICRLEKSALQKQVLFDVNTPGKVWKNIERILGVDTQQVRRTMMDKASYM